MILSARKDRLVVLGVLDIRAYRSGGKPLREHISGLRLPSVRINLKRGTSTRPWTEASRTRKHHSSGFPRRLKEGRGSSASGAILLSTMWIIDQAGISKYKRGRTGAGS